MAAADERKYNTKTVAMLRIAHAKTVYPEIGTLFPGKATDGMDAVPTPIVCGKDAIYRVRPEKRSKIL
jgi:hypothetical protein